MAHHKTTLPTKLCARCARPFAWRKKWARDWEQVRYCSDRCRSAGAAPTAEAAPVEQPPRPGEARRRKVR